MLPTAGEAPGGHVLSAVALDAAGNLAETSVPVTVAPAPAAPSDHGLPMAAGGGTVHVVAAGTWLVGPSDRVVIHPAAVWSAALAAAQAGPEALRVSLPPLVPLARPAMEPLVLSSVPWQGRVADLWLCGQLADGRGVAPAEVKLVRTDRLVARLLSPSEGAVLRAPAEIELEVDAEFKAVLARVLCDGCEVAHGSPGGLRLEPAALGRGPHRVAVVLTGSDGRSCQTAEVGVTVP
ncbi:MAG: hypothetical protein HYU66_00320 [Armatimonadetes bacterium]|nr:hypothetical protein [Armatimonadota bacterium]